MKQVKVNKTGAGISTENASIGLVKREKDGTFTVATTIQNCRGYMGQYLLAIKQHEKKVANWEPVPATMKGFPYKLGFTYVGVYVREEQKAQFFKNIEWLHGREDKAVVTKCEVFSTDTPNFYIVKGAKYWKDSCWKIMLYTFYIRCCAAYDNPEKPITGTNEYYYWPNLVKNNNEDKLLSNVKMHWSKEVFDEKLFYVRRSPWGSGWETIGRHDKEGFNSICSGKNPPMAKLLGIVPARYETVLGFRI